MTKVYSVVALNFCYSYYFLSLFFLLVFFYLFIKKNTLFCSTSEDDDIELTEADGELQLITECWVEPQLGNTVMPARHSHLNGLEFSEIPDAVSYFFLSKLI